MNDAPSEIENAPVATAAPSGPPALWRSSWHDFRAALTRVGRLARKELSEILRDRRTIVTLVAMPLLLYPLLSGAFQQFFLASKINPARRPTYYLGFAANRDARLFKFRLDQGEEALRQRPTVKLKVPEAANKPDMTPRIKYYFGTPDDLERALQEGEVDLLLRVPELRGRLDPGRDAFFTVEVVYMSNSPGALGALSYIEQRLAAANEADLRQRLNLAGAGPHAIMLGLTRFPLVSPGRDSLVSLPALVPLILILMTITGAVYPAIDLTAGERERGTLEMLVAAPVPRFELLSAKYIAVVAVAVMTALVNGAAMALTLFVSGLWPLLFAEGVSAPLLGLLFGLLLLFAAFFSAVLLCLTSFARSFKEAQAYLIPLMLASLAPGVLAMMPGLKLDLLLAGAPLVNVVLLARDLIAGVAEPGPAGVVVLTTLLYALAALSLAARVFGSENVLYNDQSGWGELFRRPAESAPTANVPAALWCLAVMVPLHFALRAILPLAGAMGTAALLLALTAGTVLLFGLLPLGFGYLGHVAPRSGFRLYRPSVASLLAGLVLGCSLWPLVLQLLSLAQGALPDFIQDYAAAAARSLRAAGLLAALPFVAAAICEEFFFRGFLFQALRRTSGPGLTIAVTSVLFGLTHTALGGALGLGQLLPSTLLGLVLGVVCWISGSVWPGLVLHVCHNALLVLLSQGGLLPGAAPDVPQVAAQVIGLLSAPPGRGPLLAAVCLAPAATEGIPTTWLLGGMIGTAIGLLLLGAGKVANPRTGDENKK
jgi:ABC-2 type transport system permease protein/sodium transport system permease protein